MSESITLTISEQDASELLTTALRSRNGLRKALEEGNLGDAGYFFGWLDVCLTRLGQAIPHDIKDPTKKDIAKANDAYMSGETDRPDIIAFGGGGNKPN
jgi:hypothetical protein